MLPTHETILILACHDVLPVFLPFEFVCSISATHRGIAREEGSALGHFRQEGNGRVRGFPNHDAADHASSLTNGGHETLEPRSEEHTSELQSQSNLVCRLLLEKKKYKPSV